MQRVKLALGWRFLLSSVLATLLVLGPFLHVHFGASSVTGFHLAGVPDSHPADSGTALAPEASGSESPAIGVGTSCPSKFDTGHVAAPGFLAFAYWIALAQCMSSAASPARWQAQAPPSQATFAAGLPPPALAPPHSLI